VPIRNTLCPSGRAAHPLNLHHKSTLIPAVAAIDHPVKNTMQTPEPTIPSKKQHALDITISTSHTANLSGPYRRAQKHYANTKRPHLPVQKTNSNMVENTLKRNKTITGNKAHHKIVLLRANPPDKWSNVSLRPSYHENRAAGWGERETRS